MYRIRRILKAGGYFDFKDFWNEFIKSTVACIANDLSEEQCLEILDIKYKALKNYKDRIFGYLMDSEGYDDYQYNQNHEGFLEEHYRLIHDLYIDQDIKGVYDVKERFLELNDAKHILSKKEFEKKIPSLRAYVENSHKYFKNKIQLRLFTGDDSSIKPNNTVGLINDECGLNSFETALKHWYLEEQGIEPMISGKQIVAKYNTKKVEVHLNQIRKLKGDCSERKGFMQNLINVKSALSQYSEIAKAIDMNIDRIK